MKSLLTLVGLATGCLLSGCAHDTNSKTESKPEAVTLAGQSASFVVTNTGTAPLTYQWYFSTNTQTVPNTSNPPVYQWYKNSTNIEGVTVTNQ